MRAYVLSRKGILLNSPDVENMSRAQWLFEYHALKKSEHEALVAQGRMFKAILVNVMGLNALRPEDENKRPKNYADMTEEEREGFLPMVAWVGRPEMLKLVRDQLETDFAIEKAHNDAAYERMVEAIDEAGDMEPIMGPLPSNLDTPSNIYKGQLDKLVKEYPGNHDASASVGTIEDVEEV